MKYEFDWKQYAVLAREAIAEGCVLLKNDNRTLPIQKGEKVSVFGRIQFDYFKSGTGSGGMVNAPYVISILDALKACKEIEVNQELLAIYEAWVEKNPFDEGEGWAKEPWCQPEMPIEKSVVEQAAKQSDLAIVILGRTAGEDRDNSAEEGSYLLSKEEENLLEKVCATFSRVAVVLNVGNIIDMKWVQKYNPQAVLYTWQGGMEGGNGIVDILTGKINPCGKLSDTIANDIADYPSSADFGDAKRNFYTEDIYVGYRYFETMAKEKVCYPFGFGLSYTDFSIKNENFKIQGDQISFDVIVKNSGDTAGKEVVQVYYAPPQGKLGKPARNLIRFAKTAVLKPGEEEKLTFLMQKQELASYDDGGKTGNQSCFVLEEGSYEIFVGSDVRSASLLGTWEADRLEVVSTHTQAMAPIAAFNRIKPMLDDKKNCQIQKEETPLRKINLQERIKAEVFETADYTGDKGYLLSDVAEHKITLEEFLAQLSDEDLIYLTRGEGMCSPKVTSGTAAAFGGVTDSLLHFGIPVVCCADGPSGVRMDSGSLAFSLPNGTLLACTFNVELVEKLYEMEGMELRKNQIDMLLGPGMNIHRNPLNGRNFEYFSEDPYLTGKMAAAELRGMHQYGVTGTIKHFACNNQEYKRHDADSVVSERALREIYLKGYEIAVKEAKAYSIMSTYGPLNGLWTAGSYDLLTTILRKEWGFDGIVMTDWWAKMNEEGGDGSQENTTFMVEAQNDIFMVVSNAYENSGNDNTKEGLQSGKIKREQLIRNAKNICNVLMKSPVMERFNGSNKDEWSILNEPKSENKSTIQKAKTTLVDNLELDITEINTKRGKSVQYTIEITQKGKYQISFTMRSYAGELAQMPMSVFLNNQLLQTVTINGTHGEWITRTVEFEVFVALDNYLKLYFGESGIEFSKIQIQGRF